MLLLGYVVIDFGVALGTFVRRGKACYLVFGMRKEEKLCTVCSLAIVAGAREN